MNKTQLIGRLTNEPEIAYSTTNDGELARAKFTLAVDRPKNREKTDFIRCIAWGGVAQIIEKYVQKGYRVGIVGHIETGSYKHKDGYTVYTTDVVAEDIDLLEPKHDNQQSDSNGSFGNVNY